MVYSTTGISYPFLYHFVTASAIIPHILIFYLFVIFIRINLFALLYISILSFPSLIYRTDHEDVILGFPLTQFSIDMDCPSPLYHVSLGRNRGNHSHIESMIFQNQLFYLFYRDERSRLLTAVYSSRQARVLSPTSIRESVTPSGHSRSSGSFGSSSRMSDTLNAEMFETGWDKTGFNDRLQSIIHRDDQEKVEPAERCGCLCEKNSSTSSSDRIEGGRSLGSSTSSVVTSSQCKYGDCLVLHPVVQRRIRLSKTPLSTHILLLPPVPSFSLTRPVVLTANGEGIVEAWYLDSLLKAWSLSLCDSVSFLGCSSFTVCCKTTKPVSPEEYVNDQSWVSHHQSSSYNQSLPFTEDPSLLFSVDGSLTTHFEDSHINLQDLDKQEENKGKYSRILVIGTEEGRLFILEEDGHILFDAYIMDVSLDKVLISKLYSNKSPDFGSTAFLITCINYQNRIFYSMLLSYSSLKEKISITPLSERFDDPTSPSKDPEQTPSVGDNTSNKSSSTLVELASHCSTESFTTSAPLLTISTDSEELSYLSDSFAGLFYCDESIALSDSIAFYEEDTIDKLRIGIPCDGVVTLYDLSGRLDSSEQPFRLSPTEEEDEIVSVEELPFDVFCVGWFLCRLLSKSWNSLHLICHLLLLSNFLILRYSNNWKN